MSPRRRIPGPVMDEIRLLAFEHPDWTPTQVHRELGDKVSLRTVQRYLADLPKASTADPWTVADADAEDLPLVLPVLRHLLEERGVKRVNRQVGEWIVKIRRAFPELTDKALIARLAGFAARGERTGDEGEEFRKVQAILMYTPWKDGGRALVEAEEAGLVRADVMGYVADAPWVVDWQQRRDAEDLEYEIYSRIEEEGPDVTPERAEEIRREVMGESSEEREDA